MAKPLTAADLEPLMRGLGERFGALRSRVEVTESRCAGLEMEIRGLRREIELLQQAKSLPPRIVAGREHDDAA